MSRKKEIDCLEKLNDEIQCFGEIIEFLSIEKVIPLVKQQELKTYLHRELPFNIHKVILQALKEDKLQLVDYIWQLLPEENICVTIVTNMARRDFTWNH